MEEKFDVSARALQHQMLEETRKAYGQKAFERWLKPLYVGTIDRPDGYARISGSYGETMEIFLRFGGERVKEATFQTNGCGAGIVCGSFAVELSIGKNPDEIAQITGETILGILGDLPEEDRHCAFLAAETLQQTVENYLKENGSTPLRKNRRWVKMPQGDRTGPRGQGPGTGRGKGRGGGSRGRSGGFGAGLGGTCVCTACGEKVAHQPGAPCYLQKCPKCGGPMTGG